MIKLIHTADVHLDSPLKTLALRDPVLREKVQCASRTAFSRIVDQAIAHQAAAVLIAGDLFDGAARSAKTAAFLLSEFNRLAEEGIRAFYIKGNHDAENPITGGVSFPDNVHVFDSRGGKVQLGDQDIWIHGVSFSGKKAEKSLVSKFPEPVPGAINIALLHTSLSGSSAHDVYAPCSVQELVDTGFDYWSLGHIHKRQVHCEAPWIVMPGIPQGRDIGESGGQSATVLSVEEGVISTETFPTSAVEFRRLLVDVSDLDDASALRGKVSLALTALADSLESDDAVVRVQLHGQSALRWEWLRDRDQWVETIRKLCEDNGRLWLEKLSFDISEPVSELADTSAQGELAALMASIRSEAGFEQEAVALIDDVLGLLPAGERKKLLTDEQAQRQLAASLGQAGEEHMLAVMKGANT